MRHWQQQACPVWHSPTTGQSSKEAASSFADGALALQLAAPQPTPLFDRVDVQTAARSGSEADLPALIRDEINQGHCPVLSVEV